MPCVEAPGSGPGRRMARGRHGLGPGRLARRGCRDDAAPGAAGVGRGRRGWMENGFHKSMVNNL